MSQIFPAGVHNLHDLPYNLFDAFRSALSLLRILEEVATEDQPPREIWDDGKAMKEHWKAVKARHKAEAGGDSDRMADEKIDGPVERNAAVGDIFA